MRTSRASSSLSPVALLLVCCGAAALFFGTANPLAHIPLLILAYPACLYVLGLGNSRPFRIGWLTGLLGASASLYWIAEAVHDYGYFPWLAAAPCAIFLGAYIGLWGGLFAKLVSLLRPVSPLRRCLAAGLLWYLMEWARGWFGSGFPWLTLSGGLAAWPELVQAVSLVGEYGLSGVLSGTGCLLAEAVLALAVFSDSGTPRASVASAGPPAGPSAGLFTDAPRTDGSSAAAPTISRAHAGQTRRRDAVRAGLVALLLLTAMMGFGWWRMQFSASAAPVDNDAEPYLVLVQGNIRQDVKWDPAFQQSTVDQYLDLSRLSLTWLPRKPTAFIWPETALPFFYQDDAELGQRLRDFARETGTSLVFGGPGYARTSPSEAVLFNRAFLIDPDGKDAGSYDKEHLVPFGEYVPSFLDFAIFKLLFQGIGGFQPGKDSPPFTLKERKAEPVEFAQPVVENAVDSTAAYAATPDTKLSTRSAAEPVAPAPAEQVEQTEQTAAQADLRLGMLICYEAIFPEIARQRVAQGATVLVNISNDAWYNRTSAPRQHLHLSLLRAVEQGRWLARATNTGFTAFVSPLGVVSPLDITRPTGETNPYDGLFIEGVMGHAVQPLTGHTVYFALHPFLPALAFLALAVIVIPLLLKTKRGIAPATSRGPNPPAKK